MNGLRMFGNAPVPFTVSWTGEDRSFVAPCPYSNRPAICQTVAPGGGKPLFGKPHSQRQRQAIAESLCDLCGKPLKNRTKVSLSHARMRSNGAEGPCIMQVEPLVHRECGTLCIRFCPSLKRDIETGTLMVRQVNRYRVQFAIMSPEYIAFYVPGYVAAPTDRIVGHAKVELQSWADRDQAWLERAAA
jgi:hypothetical protein